MYTNEELDAAITNTTLAVRLSTGVLENLHMEHLRELIRERERRVMEQSKPAGISIPPVTDHQLALCTIAFDNAASGGSRFWSEKLRAALEAYRDDIMKGQPKEQP